LGAIASAALLLRHAAGMAAEADDVEHAIREALDRGHRTPDIAFAGEPRVSTSEMGDAVEHALAEAIDRRHAYHAV
jgi:3-isopropylmalate dehydrogenase